MEISETLRSVAVRFLTTETPETLFITDLVEGIRNRYSFFEVPRKADEINPQAGIQFQLGRFENALIGKLVIYDQGVSAESPVPTEILDAFLDDLASWTTSEFGVTHRAMEPVPRSYLSSIEVQPTFDFASLFKEVSPLPLALTKMLTDEGFTLPSYEFNGFSLHVDGDTEETKPLRPGKFVFERRAGRDFSENVYYSEAPTTTANHLRLLELLEASL